VQGEAQGHGGTVDARNWREIQRRWRIASRAEKNGGEQEGKKKNDGQLRHVKKARARQERVQAPSGASHTGDRAPRRQKHHEGTRRRR
jgi:hypothetical protein